ncbi:hypothetical protein, partial [Tannerella forsythia]|uniref:hypothetical protein n=1 Tax=Tannerella forsythia TaxID=28112 RepID=UPI0028E4F47C
EQQSKQTHKIRFRGKVRIFSAFFSLFFPRFFFYTTFAHTFSDAFYAETAVTTKFTTTSFTPANSDYPHARVAGHRNGRTHPAGA